MTRSVRLLAVAVLAVVLALSAAQNAFASTEIAYDNGIYASTIVSGAGAVYAVHFSLPSGWSSAKLSGVEIWNPHFASPVTKLHVSSGQGSGSDLFTSTITLTIQNGWNTLVLSVTVPADFYIAYESFGVDGGEAHVAGGDSTRSYSGPIAGPWGSLGVGTNPLMIRALVDPIAAPVGPVGGFMEPVNKVAVFAPYLALFGAIGAVAVICWKRPDN